MKSLPLLVSDCNKIPEIHLLFEDNQGFSDANLFHPGRQVQSRNDFLAQPHLENFLRSALYRKKVDLKIQTALRFPNFPVVFELKKTFFHLPC